jgi:hypothetical protein
MLQHEYSYREHAFFLNSLKVALLLYNTCQATDNQSIIKINAKDHELYYSMKSERAERRQG